ncbi:GH16 beta-1,3-glucan recognition protein [Mycena rebaudengoi]|nr:GH16 beta-1,3-glucan recognition protein [Mycena rebaudengoi]
MSSSSSSSARPPPLSFVPPRPSFAIGSGNNGTGSGMNTPESEPPSPGFLRDAHHANTAAQMPQHHGTPGSSPPVTPRSLSFLTPNVGTPPANAPTVNPFSPPASVRSFSVLPEQSGVINPFGSPGSTRASSIVDIPRASYSTSSRPNSANSPASRPSSANSPASRNAVLGASGLSNNNNNTPGGRREAFASPPARPLTIYASAPQGGARLRRDRPKSTAILVPSASVPAAFAENPLDADGAHTDGLPKLDEKQVMKDIGKKRGSKSVPTLRAALDKPWLTMKDPRARYAYWITYATVVVFGLGMGALRIYLGQRDVILQDPRTLCSVLSEDFTGATTDSVFGDNGWLAREVDMSGFGNNQFEMTTASNANSFVAVPPPGSSLASSVEGKPRLYLLPTLTEDVIPLPQILDGAVYNITGCTYNVTRGAGYTGKGAADGNGTRIAPDLPPNTPGYLAACSGVSNATLGKILPPVMSARVSTRRSASIKFGRVEIRAKLPTGDWLWPALWMLPVDDAYGGWPLSGEIDIMEARGNAPSYPRQGVNYVRSSLNWGPTTFLNAVAKTYNYWPWRRGRFDDGFHTYVLEWDEQFIRAYVDTRLHHMLEIKLNKPFWERGEFPNVVQNGTESIILENPWVNGTKAAPFDQSFYLIMNVAVGGTNGWFPDGPEKPWLDGSGTAPRDFLQAKDKWFPSWPQDIERRAMVIDSVKMWTKCKA